MGSDTLIEVGETPRGHRIYRQVTEVGSHRYWSDEVGGGVFVWDTALVDPETLEFVLDDYAKLVTTK